MIKELEKDEREELQKIEKIEQELKEEIDKRINIMKSHIQETRKKKEEKIKNKQDISTKFDIPISYEKCLKEIKKLEIDIESTIDYSKCSLESVNDFIGFCNEEIKFKIIYRNQYGDELTIKNDKIEMEMLSCPLDCKYSFEILYDHVIKFKTETPGFYIFKLKDKEIKGSPFELNIYPSSFYETNILNDEMISKLNEWVNDPTKYWKLMYQATRDGFDSFNFHFRCDNIGETLTIIKTNKGNIFGGYSFIVWSSSKKLKSDPDKKTFIFSLKNPQNTQIKLENKGEFKSEFAIYDDPSCSPSFGDGDIYLCSDSNYKGSSYTDLGNSYLLPGYKYGSDEIKKFLDGDFNFKTIEIETCKF